MKKLLIFLLIMSISTRSIAMDTKAHDQLDLKRGIKFGHKLHFERLGFTCDFCHEAMTGGKIPDISKKWGHEKCLGCHDKLKHAPKTCKGCHVDQYKFK